MSNENLARRWAESRNPNSLSEDARAARAYILDHTTPQSMDEVAWSDEEHALAGAVTDMGGGPIDVVMLAGSVDGIDYATLNGKFGYEPRYYFTPNGKKYELREVGAPEQPARPATLETVEDYVNAPEGTTVAEPGYTAWTKVYDGNWWRGDEDNTNHWMAGTKRDVLRWGWGK